MEGTTLDQQIRDENKKNIADSVFKKKLRIKALKIIIPEAEEENKADPKIKKVRKWDLGKKEIDGLKDELRLAEKDVTVLELYISLI